MLDEPIRMKKLQHQEHIHQHIHIRRIYRSWTGLKLFIYAKGYFSYNNSTLPVGYPDAVDTYVGKAALSLWQINEWSEGTQQDPKGSMQNIWRWKFLFRI